MAIVTGDRARVVGDTTGDEGTLSRIVGIEERTSLLRRSADDTDNVERVIVANADQMLVVVAAADPEPRARLVDRYLIAALDAGIRPMLVVTKTDLADPTEFLDHFEGLDLEVFTSAPRRDAARAHRRRARRSLHRLRRALRRGQVDARQRARAHRAARHGPRQRRHRARAAHVVIDRLVPLRGPDGAGWVIDTPGVRSFGLGHINPDNILAAFTDLATVAEECPRGCTHLPDAPDCAIMEAVAAGRLGDRGAARLDSLQRLLLTFETRETGRRVEA